MIGSSDRKWRSPVQRYLEEAGAQFVPCGDGVIAETIPSATKERVGRMAIADFSARPRIGIKGPEALSWLKTAGAPAPDVDNRWMRTEDIVVARLGPAEAVMYPAGGALEGDGEVAALAGRHEREGPAGSYLLPRRDSHAWFRLVGDQAPPLFARVCSVDLRPSSFEHDQVAQTFVARQSCVIVRQDLGGLTGYHLLVDTSSARFLWGALVEVANSLGGGVAGTGDLPSA